MILNATNAGYFMLRLMMCAPAPGPNENARHCEISTPVWKTIRRRSDRGPTARSNPKEWGKERAALRSRPCCTPASVRQAAFAHTAKNCTLWATPSRFFIETSQTFVFADDAGRGFLQPCVEIPCALA